MSVYLSYLADELAEIEETLARPALAPYADRLRLVISQALIQTRQTARAARSQAEADILPTATLAAA